MVARTPKPEHYEHQDFGGEARKFDIAARIDEAVRKSGGPSFVSKETGISRKTLFNYTSGATDPKVLTLDCIAQACGVSLDWLISGEGTKERGRGLGVNLEHLAIAVQTADELEDTKNLKLNPVKKTKLILSIYESIEDER